MSGGRDSNERDDGADGADDEHRSADAPDGDGGGVDTPTEEGESDDPFGDVDGTAFSLHPDDRPSATEDGAADDDRPEDDRTPPVRAGRGSAPRRPPDAGNETRTDDEVDPDHVSDAPHDSNASDAAEAAPQTRAKGETRRDPTAKRAAGAASVSAGGGTGGGDPGGGGAGGIISGGGGGATPPDDQEMPLTDHVEEMALRVMAVGLVVIGVGAITLFYADELVNFLWYSFIGPGLDVCPGPDCPSAVSPRVYQPLALVLARLKVASLVGLIVAVPVAVYQTYRFMRPGLYPRERRYYLAAVPTSLILAAIGVGFAYFAILPAMFSYFTSYSEQAAQIAFGLTETFNLIILMIGFFALTFQIPLLVMVAIMMGVTTRRWLEDRRLYFWGGFGAVAFLFSPDPTGMAPLLVAVTMIGLFEGTLFLLRWTDSDSPLFSPDAFVARRPYGWGLAVVAGYVVSAAPVPASYYDQLPSVVRETLVYNQLVAMTPVITGLGLILLFEVLAYLVRNYSRNVRVWYWVSRLRFPYYALAVVVGYFASQNPPGLQTANTVTLPTTYAVGLAAALIAAYELLIIGLRWRQNRT